MIGRRGTLALAVVAIPWRAAAQPASAVQLTQLSCGQFKWDANGRVAGIDPSTSIRARLNVGFGVLVRVVATPQETPVTLRQITRLPTIKKPNAQVVIDPTMPSDFKASPGQTLARGFTFRKDWELQVGEWSVEIWHGTVKLLAQSFTVYLQ